MPAERRKSQGRSPLTPYTPRGRRGQATGSLLRQGTLDSFIRRRTENVPQQRESEVAQAPPTGIDALPVTVLRAILALLSATDLFLRASRVCRQWRNIISEEGFCRWKKRYFRYHQQDEAGQQEVMSILHENHMTSADNNNLCLLHMAKYMSQAFRCTTVRSERDREERILESIKSHRLYEHARACMPNSMTEKEDPWSSLALMLVLADGVGELWQLVVRLRCPLTPEQLSEFLWCSATLLRAMATTRVKISNRSHYNIFYVLHLIENVLPSCRTEGNLNGEKQLTPEQQHILNHNTESDHVVKIMAFAGTGKTTTLVSYAQQRPQLRFLYVVFNKPAQMQAQRIFPKNVTCKTIHSLAHTAVGQRYRKKLGLSGLKVLSVFHVLPKGERSIVWAKVVTKTIGKFWASTDPNIDTQHVPEWYKNTRGNMERPTDTQKRMFANQARNIWEKMKDVEPTTEAAYRMYHDGYLKLWQLEGSQMEDYDVIFIDEAQDCTPVIMAILLSQPCAKVLVGDPHQQIYSFRGAINNLTMIQHTHVYYLTQSFRFGPEIAYVGATILEVGKGVKKIMVGGNQGGSVRGQDIDMRRRYRTAVGAGDGKLAVLSRTNASIFHEAVRLTDLNSTVRVYIIGGIKAFDLNKIHDIWALKQRQGGLNIPIEDSFIRKFSEGTVAGLEGYSGLWQYAEMTEDQELLWKIAVVEVKEYTERIPELINRIRNRHQTKQQDADFILGSMHKAKGLEFDTVIITDDFRTLQVLPTQEQEENQNPVEDDDWNLIYMAVTRAQRTLFMTRTITNILNRAGEYFLRSELTTVPADNPDSQCSVPRCSNHININHHLRMHRLPITYLDSNQLCSEVDGVEKGGAVCLPCVNKMAGHLAFLMSPGIKQVPF